MTSTLTHKGYIAQLTVDADAGVIHGQVINTRDVLTFSAKSAADLKPEFIATIEDYEEWCRSLGEQPQKPLSGTISLRMGPELHQAAANRAAVMKQSLNAWIVATLECELGRRPATLTAQEVDQRFATNVKATFHKITQQMEETGQETWSTNRAAASERRSFQ